MSFDIKGFKNPHLKDFSEYKRMAGIIEGLSLAERELADWIDRHTRE